MNKMILILIFASTSIQASECKLTGVLSGDEKIETSFVTSSIDDCRKLAAKTGENKFFGLVEKDKELLKTTLSFREEEGSKKDSVSFEDEDFNSNDG